MMPGQSLAKLTNNMNCAFKCSGKQCGAKLSTLLGCLVACDPSHYEKCWVSGEQKFSERGDNADKEIQEYFEYFNKLSPKTRTVIIRTLEMARKISEMDSAMDIDSAKDVVIQPEFFNSRDKMKTMIRENLKTPDQKLKNWIRKVLSLRIKDAQSVLNLAAGGFSLSN